MFLFYIAIAIALGLLAQKIFSIPKPPNYTYLGNSVDSWEAEQNREEASSKRGAQFLIIGCFIAFFVYCIGDYKSVSKIDEPILQTVEEKSEALTEELRKNAKIQKLQNQQQIQVEQVIVPIEPQTKPKERLNSAGVPVDKNGYLQ